MEIAALDRDLAIEKSSGFDYKHLGIMKAAIACLTARFALLFQNRRLPKHAVTGWYILPCATGGFFYQVNCDSVKRIRFRFHFPPFVSGGFLGKVGGIWGGHE